jgi:uncharacterized membrane protein
VRIAADLGFRDRWRRFIRHRMDVAWFQSVFVMKIRTFLIPSLALATLLTGCVGTGPNTQQGAVAGGAVGALAGAIIGNNSRGGNALGGAIIGGTVGAIAGGAIGNSVDHQRGTIYGDYDHAYAARIEMRGPPPMIPAQPQTAEVVPACPSQGAAWIPGYWVFDGNGYFWFAGHWEMPPPNARTYVIAHWERFDRHRYCWVQSYWR